MKLYVQFKLSFALTDDPVGLMPVADIVGIYTSTPKVSPMFVLDIDSDVVQEIPLAEQWLERDDVAEYVSEEMQREMDPEGYMRYHEQQEEEELWDIQQAQSEAEEHKYARYPGHEPTLEEIEHAREMDEFVEELMEEEYQKELNEEHLKLVTELRNVIESKRTPDLKEGDRVRLLSKGDSKANFEVKDVDYEEERMFLSTKSYSLGWIPFSDYKCHHLFKGTEKRYK